jgi:hypothetical protein
MMVDKNAVAGRLKEFAKRFDSLAEFARLLNMEYPQQLQPYLTGKSLPGFELLVRLRNLGCDPNWLMSGEGKPPSASSLREEGLQYDSDEMKREVEQEVDRLVKTAQLWRPRIPASLAKELRQFLKSWLVKLCRAEREASGKPSRKGPKTK